VGTERVLGPSSFEDLGTTFGSTAVVAIPVLGVASASSTIALAARGAGRAHHEPVPECFLVVRRPDRFGLSLWTVRREVARNE
jgi:hypothetical protein